MYLIRTSHLQNGETYANKKCVKKTEYFVVLPFPSFCFTVFCDSPSYCCYLQLKIKMNWN